MSDWTRIGDDDVASFGKHTFRLKAAEEFYFIVADERDQAFVQASHEADVSRWTIELKLRRGDCFKLCGLARRLPGVLNGGYWYELILAPNTQITYWEDQKIFRSDWGIKAG